LEFAALIRDSSLALLIGRTSLRSGHLQEPTPAYPLRSHRQGIAALRGALPDSLRSYRPPALDCEPVRRVCVWEAVRRPNTGHQTGFEGLGHTQWSGSRVNGSASAVEWA